MRDFYNELITRFLYIRLIKRCDRLVFVCKSQLEHWIKAYGVSRNMCQHIYNGVDTNYFICTHSIEEKSKLRKSLGIRSSDAVICVCAALRPEKKHADLIDAAKILIEKGIPLKILMIGDGPERNKIERHIKKRGMESIVIATGFKNDVRPFICLSDIVALSSVSVETFSMAILEAMSLGKPIVATAIGGLTELVRHGENGFLVPPGDIKALAESFETIIKNNLFDCMGKRSRKLACDRFNINQMVQGYQELLLQ
jgi:glycosyltransferase involved in cell wall biosynthesis